MNKLKEKHQTMNWPQMSKLTGLHINTLRNISRYDYDRILKMQVGTLIVLQEKLGVSLLEEFKDYHSSESAEE